VADGVIDERDDETTALAVPQQAPADGRPSVLLLGSGVIIRGLAEALRGLRARRIRCDPHH
jgi:phosphoribosylglycinamide formyltransferase 2